jgi:hypothetical protein
MACSGFCVYSNKALYGMNFDFPDTEIKFMIQTYEDMKIFHMQFKSEGSFISSVGMNNKGLFCSEQELWPYVYHLDPKKNNELYFWELYNYGADRYKTAGKYISNNIQDFDFNNGIEMLKSTAQSENIYKTVCSMLFSPSEKAVYIMLQRNFNKIWKLSINQNTIETFKGFDQELKIMLDSSGILASELVRQHQ